MSGTTTIRVTRELKQDLDELLRELEGELDERLSLNDLLTRLVRVGRTRRLDLWRVSDEGPTREEWDRFVASIPDVGFETDSSRLDDDLYGG